MLSADELAAQEQQLSDCVRALTAAERKRYYQLLQKQLKDPDTYAVLNYLLLAGLHHFYLRRWWRGVLNLTVFASGVALLLLAMPWFGLVLIGAVLVVELPALFFAQRIVQHYNLRQGRAVLQQLQQRPQQ